MHVLAAVATRQIHTEQVAVRKISPLEIFDPSEAFSLIVVHFKYFIKSILLAGRMARDLVVNDSIAITACLIAAAAGVSAHLSRIGTIMTASSAVKLGILASVVFVVGALPFVMIARVPTVENFSSRFAMTSQLGILIAMALVASLVPWRVPRLAMIGITVFVFAAAQVQSGKSAMLEEAVLPDFREQMASYLDATGPQTLSVRFQPPIAKLTFRHRPLDRYDFNVPLYLSGHRHGAILFDGDFGGQTFESVKCSVSSFEVLPCPEIKRTATYRVRSDMQQPSEVPLSTLVRAVVFGSAGRLGELDVKLQAVFDEDRRE